jgi:ADP-ribosylglycohydrolase
MKTSIYQAGMTTTDEAIDATIADRIAGSIVGLAIGDALGYPHEFRSVAQVRREIGPAGLVDFVALKDPRFTRPMILGTDHPPGTFTDDTQMSLAVAEALIACGHDGSDDDDHDTLMSEMARRFVDWYFSDDNDRSPGAATGTACTALRDGASWRDSGVKESKGCGANMRVGPIGLFYQDLDTVADVARRCASITHGHPCGTEGAAAAALCVALALHGASPVEMHREVGRRISGRAMALEALWSRIPHLLHKDPAEVLVDLEKNPAGLGESWVAEEAIASAMYCFWRHPDDFHACVVEAANTDGDSDSIACIAGSIVGARVGLARLPPSLVTRVEQSDHLQDLARRLAAARG